MAQINYIEPIKYTVVDNGKLIKENHIPRCFFYLALHKQEYTQDRVVTFLESDIKIPVGLN